MVRLVFDTEAATDKLDVETWPAFYQRAGVSVACVIDAGTGIPSFYTQWDESPYDVPSLVRRLESANEVISFNGKVYDVPVLEWAVTPPGEPRRQLRLVHHVDMYERVRWALDGERWEKGSWTLDRIAKDTLGRGKTHNGGAFAPSLAKANRRGELFTYNLMDVWITWKLWEHAEREGWITNPEGKQLPIFVG